MVVAVRQHSRRRWIVAGLAGTLAALQAGLMVYAKLADNLAPSRSAGGGLVELVGGPGQVPPPGLRRRHPIDPAQSTTATTGRGRPQHRGRHRGAVVVTILALGLWRSGRRRVPLLLVAALIIVEVLVQVGSIGGGVGGRYSVVPIAILTLMAIYGATMATGRGVRIAASVLLASSLLWGLAGFWTENPTTLRCVGCPDWAEEVEQWQAGDSDELLIWPYDAESPWIIRLPARSVTSGPDPSGGVSRSRWTTGSRRGCRSWRRRPGRRRGRRARR